MHLKCKSMIYFHNNEKKIYFCVKNNYGENQNSVFL